MSQRLNQNLRSWKDVEAELRCTPMMFRGSLLPGDDSALWARSLVLMGLQLQDILSGSRSPSKISSLCKKYVYTLADLDVYDVSATFKWLSGYIRRYVNGDEDPRQSYHDFKHHGGVAEYLISCCTFVVQREIELLLTAYDMQSFRVLTQLFAFLSHVTLPSVIFDDAVSDFKTTDSSLAISASRDTLDSMNKIMRQWLYGFRINDENFHPHHGPGGVAESGRTSLYEKYNLLICDPIISECLRWHHIDANKYFLKFGPLNRTSRLVAVPKTTISSRTICMEPATLQFLQQGVCGAMSDWISTTWPLSSHIRLGDQSFNREAARVGSIVGELATIDLSSASDCVSWGLTRALFAGTDYVQWCLATRSRYVSLPSDDVVQLNKFAPMGSALCFPTECLVFACSCELVSRRHHTHSKYCVYGDDIVIEQDLVEDLVQLLTSLGFRVNQQKSFSGEHLFNFRESCGGEYVNGVSVTPMRLSRWLSGDKLDIPTLRCHPELLTRQIDLVNAAYENGLFSMRAYLLQEILSLPSSFHPVFGDGLHGTIYSPMPDNYRHCHRFSMTLQRLEYWTFRLVMNPDRRDLLLVMRDDYEDIRLHHWFVSSALRSVSPFGDPDDELEEMRILQDSCDPLYSLCRRTTKLGCGFTYRH